MRRSLHLALAAAAISLVGAVPALAASTGLENIHTLRREHGRLVALQPRRQPLRRLRRDLRQPHLQRQRPPLPALSRDQRSDNPHCPSPSVPRLPKGAALVGFVRPRPRHATHGATSFTARARLEAGASIAELSLR